MTLIALEELARCTACAVHGHQTRVNDVLFACPKPESPMCDLLTAVLGCRVWQVCANCSGLTGHSGQHSNVLSA